MFSFFGIIDLISILPFYIKKFVLLDGRFFRILRLFRLSRIFKLGRGSKSLKLFTKAIGEVKSELYFTLFLSLLTILFSASAIYFLEHDAQPEIFSSITASIWWATVSLATVGYGDITGSSTIEIIFSMAVEFVGLTFFSFLTGTISVMFSGNQSFEALMNARMEQLDLWLVRLENCNKTDKLPNKLYDTIKEYIQDAFIYDFNLIIEEFQFYNELPP